MFLALVSARREAGRNRTRCPTSAGRVKRDERRSPERVRLYSAEVDRAGNRIARKIGGGDVDAEIVATNIAWESAREGPAEGERRGSVVNPAERADTARR